MNIYLLRHAIAAQPAASGFPDSKRPLTAEGRKKLRQAAEGMTALNLKFDLILSSPFLRARQTAEIIADQFDTRSRLEFSEHLRPESRPTTLIQELQRLDSPPDDVLLVGHEPFMSRFISMLCSGGPDCAVTMKKSGLCKLKAESIGPGRCATIEWLLTPKQLAMLR